MVYFVALFIGFFDWEDIVSPFSIYVFAVLLVAK